MGLSKRWLMSILIASGLLLSAASPSPQQESPSPRIYPDNSSDRSHQIENTPKPEKPPTTKGDQKQAPGIASENKSDSVQIILPPITVQKDWADYGLFLFSGLLVIVAGLQLRLLNRAFITDRPYLLLDSPKIAGFRQPLSQGPSGDVATSLEEALQDIGPLLASLRVRNYGKGPALLVSIATRITIAPRYPAVGDFSQCIGGIIPQDGIVAGGCCRIRSDWSDGYQMDAPGNFDDITSLAKTLMFYGIICYKDVFNKRYTTSFLYKFQPPIRGTVADVITGLIDKGHLERGPDAYNRST